jgi:hypothetical protein
MRGDDSHVPDTNNFATYAFPHVTDKLGNSGGKSLKQCAHFPTIKYSDYKGTTKELDIDYCHPCNAREKHHDSFSLPQELQSQSTDEDSS